VDPAGAASARPISHLANGSCPWTIGRQDGGWFLSACLAAGMTALRVSSVSALEILDSRGRPTLQVAVTRPDGTSSLAGVPSGASTGRREAVERRDGDRAGDERLGERLTHGGYPTFFVSTASAMLGGSGSGRSILPRTGSRITKWKK